MECKFQDNIEFLQWMKKSVLPAPSAGTNSNVHDPVLTANPSPATNSNRYWDQYYPGGSYDALARRKTAGMESVSSTNTSMAAPSGPARSTVSTSRVATTTAANGIKKSSSNSSVESKGIPTKPIAKPGNATRGTVSTSGNGHGGLSGRERAELESDYQRTISDLTQQALELKLNVEQVEKERDFYFGKLREIEIFVQQALEGEEVAPLVQAKLKEVQAIMYKTEEYVE